ncbi:MAG TPA: efflux RND transporter periplasmic adaptor subunit [Acidimicrobiales bacterium]|nr:efflux RND transporter periplasmic adaptor subunit [Acidimicrobiales bacterium]
MTSTTSADDETIVLQSNGNAFTDGVDGDYGGSRRKRYSLIVAGLAAVLVVLAVAAYIAHTRMSGSPNVAVAIAEPAVVEAEPGGVGTLSPVPQDVMNVELDVTGINAPITVEQVFVDLGSTVRPGAPLVQLSPAPFQQDVRNVELTLLEAEQTLAADVRENSSLKARPGTFASPYLSTTIPELRGQVQIDQQLLAIAQGNTTVVRAPIGGQVSSVYVSNGSVVKAGQPILQLVQLGTVEVSAAMLLTDLQDVRVGDRAAVTPNEIPGVTMQGKVIAIEPVASGGGLQGTALIAATNRASQPVPIGTQVDVDINAAQMAAVTVPNAAVLDAELNPIVLVVRNGRVYPVPVVVGPSDLYRTAVVSGLSAGEEVAVSDTQQLSAGERVHVVRVSHLG